MQNTAETKSNKTIQNGGQTLNRTVFLQGLDTTLGNEFTFTQSSCTTCFLYICQVIVVTNQDATTEWGYHEISGYHQRRTEHKDVHGEELACKLGLIAKLLCQTQPRLQPGLLYSDQVLEYSVLPSSQAQTSGVCL